MEGLARGRGRGWAFGDRAGPLLSCCRHVGGAQHVIFQNNDEKRYLYAGVRRCYDQVCALAPYKLEHIDIPWNGTLVSGNLHLCPAIGPPRPLIFYIPGCDTMKEGWPHPQFNFAHMRGMHVFSFDGPGQAECNLRGIRLTAAITKRPPVQRLITW